MLRVAHRVRRLPQAPRLRRAALCTAPEPTFSRYESGLKFRDTHIPETGRIAEDGDELSLHYTGRLVVDLSGMPLQRALLLTYIFCEIQNMVCMQGVE